MTTPQMPAAQHDQFDELCAPLEDFEPLPSVSETLEPYDGWSESDWEEKDESLDDMILAGLVAPY